MIQQLEMQLEMTPSSSFGHCTLLSAVIFLFLTASTLIILLLAK